MNFKRFRPLLLRLVAFKPALLFGLVFAAVFLLYLLTLAPGVVGGDAGEHQFAVPLLGIPHTTGYPLYVLAGKLWTLLVPIGSMAYRMNLFSALGGALAAAMTALAVYRLPLPLNPPRVPLTWPGAAVSGIVLAFGLTLWQWSVIAGVRSFNIFFFALLTLLAFTWAERLKTDGGPAAETTLRWLAVVVGLSLAHHRTTIFYLPSLVGWIAWHDPRIFRQPRRILTLALLALAPLSLYGFIYVRGVNNPPYTHEPVYNLQSFWFLVGSGDSTGLFFSIDPAFLPARLAFIWADVLRQLSWPGVILSALGAALLLWKRPAHFVFTGLLVALLLLFTLDFEVVNLNEAPTWYLMPAYFIFALWAGLGLNGIYDLRFTIYAPRTRQFTIHHLPFTIYHSLPALLFTAAALVLLAFTLGWPNWQQQQAQSTAPLDDWRQLLRGTQAGRFVESSLPYVEPNSIIWSDWEQYTPLRYYQLINQVRPDVTARNPLNEWPQKVAAAHAAGQPIYLARKPTDLAGTPYLSMTGPLIRIGTEAQLAPPEDIIPANINFEGELELLGYRAALLPQHTPGGTQAGPILQVTLFWRAPRKLAWDYALSLRVLDAAGQELVKRDAVHPVLSSYPTSLWSPGEVVGDFYELAVPPQAGPVRLLILPYRTEAPDQWYNLTPTGADTAGAIIGPFAAQ